VRTQTRPLIALSVAALTLAMAGCSSSSDSASSGDFPSGAVKFMVPSGAGGGWDTTARTMAEVIEGESLTKESIQVSNVEGGGGATGLAQLQGSKGDPNAWMMTGLVMFGALQQADSEVTLEDTTPIATLTSEAEAFVVPADSEFESIEDVVKAFAADPTSVTFGGGSAGGSDQMVVGELMSTAGEDAAAIKYVPYDGGGEAIAGLLNGDVEVGVSGVSEFEAQIASGDLRLLAISTADTMEVAGEDAPTLQDAGYDIDFSNWRGVVAAPGLSADDEEAVSDFIDELHGTQAWKDALEENGWSDFYKTGDEADAFFSDESERVADLYDELGL
jgi:putative tricarboxylic transport membrane protein